MSLVGFFRMGYWCIRVMQKGYHALNSPLVGLGAYTLAATTLFALFFLFSSAAIYVPQIELFQRQAGLFPFRQPFFHTNGVIAFFF